MWCWNNQIPIKLDKDVFILYRGNWCHTDVTCNKNSFADIIIQTELKMGSKSFPLSNRNISPSSSWYNIGFKRNKKKVSLTSNEAYHDISNFDICWFLKHKNCKCLENQAQTSFQIENFIICILRVCIMTKHVFLIKITFKCLVSCNFPQKFPNFPRMLWTLP